MGADHPTKGVRIARRNTWGSGPRGQLWRDTTIHGHRGRGTGVLNNELYLGHLVWNRQRFVKDPRTGKRVARPNPREAWVVEEVPHLRIVDDALWDRVKARQAQIDATPKVRALKKNRFWEHRRSMHLITGLVQCCSCGDTFISASSDYLACGNARKLDHCAKRKAIRRSVLEDLVLELVRQGLMQPEIVRAFVSAYTQENNAGRAETEAERARRGRELATLTTKIEGLYDAIADGFRGPGLLAKLEGLEAEKYALDQALSQPPPPPVRLHSNLAELYRQKVDYTARRWTTCVSRSPSPKSATRPSASCAGSSPAWSCSGTKAAAGTWNCRTRQRCSWRSGSERTTPLASKGPIRGR